MEILGISRDKRFSPNSAARDEAIFALVAEGLRRRGHVVKTCSEEEIQAMSLADFAQYDVAFSMARGDAAIRLLSEVELTHHLPVVNSARSIHANTRARLVALLMRAGVPQPPTVVVDTSTLSPLGLDGLWVPAFPLWVKRGDACAQSATDVSYVADRAALEAVAADFRAKAISEAVLVEHVPGDLLKFYGVEGSPFFHSLYPTDGGGFSKFGLEAHNGPAQHYAYDSAQLKSCADHAARVSGFLVYGGDAIIRPDGSFQIIDFNDWPSFSPCREEAAEAIVRRLLEQ